MTISTRAYNGIKLWEGIPVVPFTGKPRYRSTAKPTGEDIPFIKLKSAAEAAAMSLRRRVFSRRAE